MHVFHSIFLEAMFVFPSIWFILIFSFNFWFIVRFNGFTVLHFYSFVVSQETPLPSAAWSSTTLLNPDIGIREKYLNSNPASQGTQPNSSGHFSRIVFYFISHAPNVYCSDCLEVARSGHNDGLLCSTGCTATRGIFLFWGEGPLMGQYPPAGLYSVPHMGQVDVSGSWPTKPD